MCPLLDENILTSTDFARAKSVRSYKIPPMNFVESTALKSKVSTKLEERLIV